MPRLLISARFSPVALVFLLILAAGLGGCSRGVRTEPGAFEGPEIGLTQVDAIRVVTADAPSSGWAVSHDQTRDRLDAQEVFVTLRRPNPAYLYGQAIVRHQIITPVRADYPIRVFGRVVDFDDEKSGAPYRLAVEDLE